MLSSLSLTSIELDCREILKRLVFARSKGGEPIKRSGCGFCLGVDRAALMSISSCSALALGLSFCCRLLTSADGARSGTAIGISTKSSQTQTRALRVSSSGPWSGVFKVSTTFQACPFITAVCFAYILSLKSASCVKHRRRASCVSLHHCLEVRSGRKWRRVASEKGCPMRETGRNNQPNG